MVKYDKLYNNHGDTEAQRKIISVSLWFIEEYFQLNMN